MVAARTVSLSVSSKWKLFGSPKRTIHWYTDRRVWTEEHMSNSQGLMTNEIGTKYTMSSVMWLYLWEHDPDDGSGRRLFLFVYRNFIFTERENLHTEATTFLHSSQTVTCKINNYAFHTRRYFTHCAHHVHIYLCEVTKWYKIYAKKERTTHFLVASPPVVVCISTSCWTPVTHATIEGRIAPSWKESRDSNKSIEICRQRRRIANDGGRCYQALAGPKITSHNLLHTMQFWDRVLVDAGRPCVYTVLSLDTDEHWN